MFNLNRLKHAQDSGFYPKYQKEQNKTLLQHYVILYVEWNLVQHNDSVGKGAYCTARHAWNSEFKPWDPSTVGRSEPMPIIIVWSLCAHRGKAFSLQPCTSLSLYLSIYLYFSSLSVFLSLSLMHTLTHWGGMLKIMKLQLNLIIRKLCYVHDLVIWNLVPSHWNSNLISEWCLYELGDDN